MNKAEARFSSKVSYILLTACDEIVDSDDLTVLGQKPIAKMRSKKSRCSGYNRAHLISL